MLGSIGCPLEWYFSSLHRGRRLELGLCGLTMPRQVGQEFLVDDDRCFGCGACIALCPVNVLTLVDRLAVVDEENCTHCKICIPSCPVFALEITSPKGD